MVAASNNLVEFKPVTIGHLGDVWALGGEAPVQRCAPRLQIRWHPSMRIAISERQNLSYLKKLSVCQ